MSKLPEIGSPKQAGLIGHATMIGSAYMVGAPAELPEDFRVESVLLPRYRSDPSPLARQRINEEFGLTPEQVKWLEDNA